MNRKSLFSSGSLVLLGLLFIALVMLSGLVLKGWRVDLTENRQYTLSEGTYRVLENMQEPVTLYFFFSQEASGELPQVRSYARWIGEMLDDMADRSDGKLEIRTIDPEPFSREEDEAARFGLQSVPVGTVGDPLYFGLAGTNSLDDVQIIPFLNPAKQPLVEYDIAKLVASLSHPEQLKVGLLSSLDLEPGFDMATQEPRPAWVIYDQLEQLFEVVDVSNDAAQFPDDLDLLMVIHPKALSEAMQYRIDQFVLSGGRLVAFLDPFAEADLGDDPSDPMARLNAGSSSNLEPLLASWGVEYDPLEVVGDQLYALQVNSQASVAADPPPGHPGGRQGRHERVGYRQRRPGSGERLQRRLVHARRGCHNHLHAVAHHQRQCGADRGQSLALPGQPGRFAGGIRGDRRALRGRGPAGRPGERCLRAGARTVWTRTGTGLKRSRAGST